MHNKTGRFVDHQQVGVLEHDGERDHLADGLGRHRLGHHDGQNFPFAHLTGAVRNHCRTDPHHASLNQPLQTSPAELRQLCRQHPVQALPGMFGPNHGGMLVLDGIVHVPVISIGRLAGNPPAMLLDAMNTPKTRPNEDEDTAPGASLLGNVNLSDPQVRALRIAVIVMGVLLVMGLVAVIGRIIYLMARPAGQISVSAGPVAPEISTALPAGAHVRSISVQGDRLAIHYETAAGSGISVVDLASGRTLSRVRLVPEAPKP